MPRITIPDTEPFSLDFTLSCGQVFRWEKQGAWWRGIVGREIIRIRQEDRILIFNGGRENAIRDYFQLDLDLKEILQSIDRDPVIHGSIERCWGLRIIHQQPWECLASYICATYANIPGIRKKIALLSSSFGDPLITGSQTAFGFPSADVLASSALCNLSRCGLGYRAPYLCETATMIAQNPGWAEKIAAAPYEQARKELLLFKGVGPKVADCVLLFAFGKYDSFPVDVWIARIMQHCYSLPASAGYEQIAREGRAHFGKFAGYAQEYLFCDRKYLTSGIS
ncbi:MAG: 8-oxoguanine DNA glycosylase [Methanoregulaceae archaeon]|nr:8-oxoguanine DNA glycosylase [Methanoregulaceae archaeon]